MMQSLLEAHSKVKARECFRRPQHTDTVPFNRVDRKSRMSPQKIYARLNRKITSLSLDCPPASTSTVIRYPIAGSNRVEAICYSEPSEKNAIGQIWINQTQYFEGISPALWNFSLGGRQLCQKWLQERQGSTLCEQSIQHYQRKVTILKDMVELMAKIDSALQERQSHSSLTPALSY
ncbi:hypothetical protein H6F43_01845 [Leptolyngbya sp. FACHB-36]|uniref:type ISP restriction/modification enzyme n=1 Tax=Leptolyngbya sp. FACHB-36 TaxID=2692808 RepID=UPI00168018AA|nr:type ISP restriction/modification enzyme [Leptolyngbya sp. FACHB-36]MBD2018928.1 hypothetical protein [Leptolyngbya sp. FACHB-36]